MGSAIVPFSRVRSAPATSLPRPPLFLVVFLSALSGGGEEPVLGPRSPEARQKLARRLGYAVTLSSLLAITAVLGFLAWDYARGPLIATVRFSEVGTLMEGDPVELRGVPVGRVRQVRKGKREALVELEIFRRLDLAADSRFINFNHSLMGARMVLLAEGRGADRLDFGAVQEGVFEPGIAESIHQVEKLLGVARDYAALGRSLREGGEGRPSAQAFMEESVYPLLEGYSRLADKLGETLEKSEAELVRYERTAAEARILTRTSASLLEDRTRRGAELALRLSLLLEGADTLITKTEGLLARAADTASLSHALLTRRETYENLVALTKSLEKVVSVLRQEGVQDILHFWRNVRISGRPRPGPDSPAP